MSSCIFVKSLPSSAPPDVSSMLAQPLISELWDPAFVFLLLQLQKGVCFPLQGGGQKVPFPGGETNRYVVIFISQAHRTPVEETSLFIYFLIIIPSAYSLIILMLCYSQGRQKKKP